MKKDKSEVQVALIYQNSALLTSGQKAAPDVLPSAFSTET